MSEGLTDRDLCLAVRLGRLLRPRRGRYVRPDTHSDVVAAIALGGRLDCVSLLHVLGIFVFETGTRHIAVSTEASRLPSLPAGYIRHWRDDGDDGMRAVSDLVAAVAQAVRCQTPRHALATLDSVVHSGLLDLDAIDEVFQLLPRRFRALRPLVDGRCESGPETLVRLTLRALGADVDIQVFLNGVGWVDFVVDGWLIVECDSRAHHSAWSDHCRDRRRDVEAAALGYTTIRLLAEDILYRPDAVLALLRSILATGESARAVHNSGRSPRTTRDRPSSRAAGPGSPELPTRTLDAHRVRRRPVPRP